METFKSQDYNVHSFTVKLDQQNFRLDQDVASYKDYAQRQRAMDGEVNPLRKRYRSFAIIPDIVAIDILTKYGINIHAPEFMQDLEQYNRFKKIIQTEYPDLLTSNIKKA